MKLLASYHYWSIIFWKTHYFLKKNDPNEDTTPLNSPNKLFLCLFYDDTVPFVSAPNWPNRKWPLVLEEHGHRPIVH